MDGNKRKEHSKDGVVTDPRFQRLHSDPRFRKFPKDTHKVQIDERFKAMFEDEAFQGVKTVDKRGRKVGKQRRQDLKRYYRLKDQELEDADTINGTQTAEPAVNSQAAAVPKTPSAKAGKKAAKQQADVPEKVPKTAKGKQATRQIAQAESDSEHEQLQAAARHAATQEQSAEDSGSEGAPGGPSEGSSDEDGTPMTEEEKRWARARGLLEISGSDSETDSSSDSDSDVSDAASMDSADREMDVKEWGVGAMAANPEEQVPESSATKRIALVDLDWRMMSAIDILAALRSFCPQGGRVLSVTVYPSDYGLEQMAAEQAAGPQAVFRSSKADEGNDRPAQQHRKRKSVLPVDADNIADSDLDLLESTSEGDADETGSQGPLEGGLEGALSSEDDADIRAAMAELSGSDEAFSSDNEGDSEGDLAENGNGLGSAAGLSDSDSDGGMTEEEKVLATRIRAYERSKLRWYYAVAVCDSVRTASHIYDECDGLEFQRSACKFDMRFVPDDMDLKSRKVRDTAKDVPANYEPPNFHSTALQHTRAKLTWDEDDVQRKRALSRKVAVDELKEDDFKAYLASESDSEQEDDDPKAAAERYRLLLTGAPAQPRKGKQHDWDKVGSDSEADSDEQPQQAAAKPDKSMEMEVTFTPGLEQLGKKILEQKRDKKQKEGETVWEAYMRRKREKRRLAKEMGRARVDDSSDDSDGDMQDEQENKPKARKVAATDDPFDDPFFNDDGAEGIPMSESDEEPNEQPRIAKKGSEKDKKGKKGKKEAAAEAAAAAKRAAELELLLMDDNALMHMATTGSGALLTANSAADQAANGNGTVKAKASKSSRLKAKKAAKKREREHGSDDEDLGAGGHFAADLSDPRFAAVLTSPEFALDPTDPRYKQAQNLAKQVHQQRSKAGSKVVPGKTVVEGANEAKPAQQQSAVANDASLSAMVTKLKNKSKKQKG